VFENIPGRKLHTLVPVTENPLNQKMGQAVPLASHDCNTLAGFEAVPDYLAKSNVMLSIPELPPSAHQTDVPCSATSTTTPADRSVASGEACCSTASTASTAVKPKETATQLKEREKRARKAHVDRVCAAEEGLQGKENLWRPYLNSAAQVGGLTFGGPTRNSEPAHVPPPQAETFQAMGARHAQELSQLSQVHVVAIEKTPRKLGNKDAQCELSKVEQDITGTLLRRIEGEHADVNKKRAAAKRRAVGVSRNEGGRFKSKKK
jgi:hypothetical protein